MVSFSYMLAPLEDMASNAFRSICHKYGADLTFTEMTRIESLAKKNKSTWSRIELKDDTPTVIQLFGAKEMHFKRFLNMQKMPGILFAMSVVIVFAFFITQKTLAQSSPFSFLSFIIPVYAIIPMLLRKITSILQFCLSNLHHIISQYKCFYSY